MQALFDLLGLEANWLPALIGLVGLPLLYASLATDVHREYASVVKDARDRKPPLTKAEMARLNNHIDGKTQLFQLDWWVVGAFGALLFAIMSCSNVQSLCTLPLAKAPSTQGALVPLCSVSFNDLYEKGVKAAMAIYGTMFAILIGFRLIWARVELAREAKTYYACDFKLPGVLDPPAEKIGAE